MVNNWFIVPQMHHPANLSTFPSKRRKNGFCGILRMAKAFYSITMKVSLNIALTVVAIILVVSFGYFILAGKSPAPVPPVQSQNTIASTKQLSEPITYDDPEYGFNLSLPASWKGYSVIKDEWIGTKITKNIDIPSEKGPLVSIRHPLWTKALPRQDIPVMVITIAQWDDLEKEKIHIGAAPINPMELDRNAKYVFALPARYNYAFLNGYDEVQKILAANPLKAF